VLLLSVLLAACGSSVKDYADATPLSDIQQQLKVRALWAAATGEVPEYLHRQLPIAVQGQQLYVANSEGKVMAFNSRNGKRLWSRSLGEVLTGGPAVSADMLFVATREADVVALDRQDGHERWRHHVSSEMLAQPVVSNNLLIVQTIDGKVTALEAASGQRVWLYERSIPTLTLRGTGKPLVNDSRVLAGFSDGKLVSLDVATGKLQWEATVAVPHGRTDIERLVDIDGMFHAVDGIVYVISYQGRVAAVSEDNGNILWARDMSSYTGLAVDDTQLYVTDDQSNVWALDRHSGATVWRQDKLQKRELSVPVVIGSAVVVADYDGYIHWLAKADGQFVARENLDKLWRRLQYVWEDEDDAEPAFRSVTTAPVVEDHTLYVRDNTGALVALQLSAN
jgi:outer membrane protein assembly factor BamB